MAAELGLNTLSGAGLIFSYAPFNHLAVMAGGGYNVRGAHVGGQLRGELLTGNATPWLGLGLTYDFGLNGTIDSGSYTSTTLNEDGTTTSTYINGQRSVTIGAGPALQLVGGVSWVTDGGFFLLSTAGYAISLSSGAGAFALFDARGPFGDFFTGSGPVLGLALGYAF